MFHRHTSDSPAHEPLSDIRSYRALLLGDAVGLRRWIFEPTLTIAEIRAGQICTHVLNRGPAGVRSPIDGL